MEDEKKVYIIEDCDTDYSRAVKLTAEQAKAIRWFIDFADLNYCCDLPEDCAIDVEVN